MSWFNKKEEKTAEMPELPPLPDNFSSDTSFKLPKLPEKPEVKEELPKLPTIPSMPDLSPLQERRSERPINSMIKEKTREIEKIPISGDYNFPDQQTITKEIEEPEFKMPRIKEVREIKSAKLEPVFVRIDKYQESLLGFHEIKKKILEIESLLKDIKEIKSKEELELQSWEEEIRKTKERLAEIDSDLFQKVG